VKPGLRGALVMGLLGVLPLVAFAPALREHRLLGPGDGAAFHYPLRRAAWESWPLPPSWNPSVFGGAPLLPSYRVGALYPPTVLAGLLEPFLAFNSLVVLSLGAAAVLTFAYLRALGAESVGAFLGGLSFGLGPYLIDHFGDSATLFAAPTLPLLLWALESHLNRGSLGRGACLSGAVALVLLGGSPETLGAAAILVGLRLTLASLDAPPQGRPAFWLTAIALLCGFLLAAPQLVPTLIAMREAGRGSVGLASGHRDSLPGLTGRILRYVSHTPAPALALSALPIALESPPIQIWLVSIAVVLGLQWGRGPLAAPSSLSMAFDFSLAILAGLALSMQWRRRLDRTGTKLRGYFLFAAFASALALSISAAALGPLPESLALAVGLLAFAVILYFSCATLRGLRAGIFLVPLAASFLVQPGARGVWDRAPTRHELEEGTPTGEAISRAMGQRKNWRSVALVRNWPRLEAEDLGYANLSPLLGRTSANGYDPSVPRRTRRALGEMSSSGVLPGAFFRGDPVRLELLGILWAEVPTSALTSRPDPFGLGETLDLRLEVGRPHYFPLPMTPATQVRIASHLSGAVLVPQDQPIARVRVRLASGRSVDLLVRAGRETSEWAYDRPDVLPAVRHQKATVLESIRDPNGFEGHRYLGILALPGRYIVEGLELERLPGPGEFTLSRMGLVDLRTGAAAPVSLAAAYVSDEVHFAQVFETPSVRLFELPQSLGPARVTERLRLLPDDEAVLRVLDAPQEAGFDPSKETLATEKDAAGIAVPAGSAASRAEVTRAKGAEVRVDAVGPGLLVLAQNFESGWSARVDGSPARVFRVNYSQMGVVLSPGAHFVELRHHARGLLAGLALSACPLLGALAFCIKARMRSRIV
jgi:hypothetical protein